MPEVRFPGTLALGSSVNRGNPPLVGGYDKHYLETGDMSYTVRPAWRYIHFKPN
jgi:hypothetical protein